MRNHLARPARRRSPLHAAVCLAVVAFILALAGSAAGLVPAAQGAGIRLWKIETSTTQAGGHPDIGVHIGFGTRFTDPSAPGSCGCQDPKDIITHMPTGFIGNPHAVPACTLSEFASTSCPPDTQVGVFYVDLSPSFAEPPLGLISPVYNLEPHADEAGLLAADAPFVGFPIFLSLSARTEGDYGLDIASFNTFHLAPVPALDVYLWGVPALPIHDAARFSPLYPILCIGLPTDQTQDFNGLGVCHAPTPSNAPDTPFLENPTSCGSPLEAGLDLTYYDESHFSAQTPWPATTGCDQLSFNPSLLALPTTEQADTTSGLDVVLKVPQPRSPTVPSSSELKSSTTTLPPGFTLTPSGVDGKVACTDTEASFGTRASAQCPEFSKVGTVEIDSSALPGPISGGIFIGRPLPNQVFRLILTADGSRPT